MTTNSQLSTTEPKEKQKQKQTKQTTVMRKQNHRNGDHVESYQWGGWRGRGREKDGGKDTGNKKHKWSVQIRRGS